MFYPRKNVGHIQLTNAHDSGGSRIFHKGGALNMRFCPFVGGARGRILIPAFRIWNLLSNKGGRAPGAPLCRPATVMILSIHEWC